VKPWDDETAMVKLEEVVRAVQMPGLHWGACEWCNSSFFTWTCSEDSGGAHFVFLLNGERLTFIVMWM